MAKAWREEAAPSKHRDFMTTRNEGGTPVEASEDNLVKKWVYFAEVGGFTFQFADIDQVLEAREYFSNSIHESTRERGHDLEHYWHPWYSRLPKGITKKKNKVKVIKALDEILIRWAPTHMS